MRKKRFGPETAKEPAMRVNQRIRAREVRVIDADGAQLGILSLEDAMAKAEEKMLDLVEVSPTARPPVCKIMDFGKFKYTQKKRQNEAKKHQTVILVKEVKFRPKTEKHDFEVKVKNIKRFLAEGNKAKVTIMFRGREVVHSDIGRDILKRVGEECKAEGTVEQMPKLEGRNMTMIVAPVAARVAPAPGAPAPAPAAAAPGAAAPTTTNGGQASPRPASPPGRQIDPQARS